MARGPEHREKCRLRHTCRFVMAFSARLIAANEQEYVYIYVSVCFFVLFFPPLFSGAPSPSSADASIGPLLPGHARDATCSALVYAYIYTVLCEYTPWRGARIDAVHSLAKTVHRLCKSWLVSAICAVLSVLVPSQATLLCAAALFDRAHSQTRLLRARACV